MTKHAHTHTHKYKHARTHARARASISTRKICNSVLHMNKQHARFQERKWLHLWKRFFYIIYLFYGDSKVRGSHRSPNLHSRKVVRDACSAVVVVCLGGSFVGVVPVDDVLAGYVVVLRLVGLFGCYCYHHHRSIAFWVILLTNRPTNKQTKNPGLWSRSGSPLRFNSI